MVLRYREADVLSAARKSRGGTAAARDLHGIAHRNRNVCIPGCHGVYLNRGLVCPWVYSSHRPCRGIPFSLLD